MRVSRFLLGLTATVLLAQTPTPPAGAGQGLQGRPAVKALQNALGLSDTQVQQLVQLRKDEVQVLQPVRQQIRDKRQALQTARESANPNPTTVGQLVLDLQKLQDQVRSTDEDYHNRALAFLDTAQKSKLGDLQQSVQRPARARAAVMAARALNLLLPPQGMRGLGPGN
jgi:Spy/CpxP family protein refolding chaperone